MLSGKSFLILLLIVFIPSLFGEAAEMAVIKQKTSKVRDISSGPNKIVLEYEFSKPVISSGTEYDTVSIEGLQAYQQTGAPIVPVKPVTVLVPFGKKVADAKVTLLNTSDLEGTYRLPPAQKPYPLSYQGKVEQTKPSQAIYGKASPWPGINHKAMDTQSKRGYQLFTVNLFPLQYIPTTGKLTYSSKMRLEVKLVDSTSTGMLRPSKETKSALSKKVDNPSLLAGYPAQGTPVQKFGVVAPLLAGGPYKYVIITNEALKNASSPWNFQALCATKTAGGIPATIVTTEWIYANYIGTRPDGGSDNQTRIRNFLIDAYNTWGTEYVLLGGTNAIVPARMFWVESWLGGYETMMPTDMYYGCVEPNTFTFDFDADGKYGEPHDGVGGGDVDLFAEIYVGRAPVENATEVANFVRKTLTYNTTEEEYLPRIAMVGEYLGFGGVAEYATDAMEQIRLGGLYDGYYTYGFEEHDQPSFTIFDTNNCMLGDPCCCWPLYDAEGYDWPKTNLTCLMNGGVHCFNHLGHANYTYDMKLDTSDLSLLTNTDYFFAYSQGCMPGGFDTTNCFAEVITTMEHGAFAAVMNACYGWGMFCSTDGPSQRFARQFWDAPLGEGILEIGRANQDSKEDNLWDINGPCIRWCYYELNLFGDPQQQFRFNLSAVKLTKVDDVNRGDCVGPGHEITYTISYGNQITDPCNPRYVGTLNNVNIIDYLPVRTDFNSATGSYTYDSNTVTWNIGTLSPGQSGFVQLNVKVNDLAAPGSVITNHCELSSSSISYIVSADVNTCVIPPPPPAPASINYPSNSSTGQYAVSWSSSNGATSYHLERSDNGGIWTQIYSGASTSYPENVGNGNYRYRIKATNSGGSSSWTTGTWDCVVFIPLLPAPASINYPTSSSTGQYMVSWSSSSGATSYQLERSSNGGSTWAQIYSGPNTFYQENVGNDSFRYRVKATNNGGSSDWRTGTWDCVVFIPPPPKPASINYPFSNSTGQYTVSWSSSSGATSYQLERSNNGGSTWTQVYSGAITSYQENVGNGSYQYRVKTTNGGGSSSWTTGSWDCAVPSPSVTYVDADAPGPVHDGKSWTTARKYLQDALVAVGPCGGSIRVAGGICKPDQGWGKTAGDRNATFQLLHNVAIYGGYAGYGEPDPNARNIGLYETILSGDIGIIGNANDNSYHVVNGSWTDETAIIDGFTITAGNAGTNGYGGGMYSYGESGEGYYSAKPRVSNCIFSSNKARYGGGMANCGDGGGAANPTVINCIFHNNDANDGGGMYNSYTAATVTNCTFSENSSQVNGGGMYNEYSDVKVTNCIFCGNNGGGIEGLATVTYSDVQGGYTGDGNIDADPLFVDPANNDYHLMPDSPCIDVGTNNPFGGLPPSDIDGQPRIMCCDVDMGADEYYCQPTTPNQSQCPSPKEGSSVETEPNRIIVLSWSLGINAVSHDVYFGTSQNDVNDATVGNPLGVYKGRQTSCSYSATNLKLGNTYYWRIDEVNESHPENPCKGNVWSFVFDHIVVDNFESYNSSNPVSNVWAGSALSWDDPDASPIPGWGPHHFGQKGMKFEYTGSGVDTVQATFPTIAAPGSQDWTEIATGAKVLAIWMRGWNNNDSMTTLYVQLKDSSNVSSNKIYYSATGDPDVPVKGESWVNWNIKMSDFTTVNKAAIRKLIIGRDAPGVVLNGEIYVDDIRLYPSRCVPEKNGVVADIAGDCHMRDCIVNFYDYVVMAEDWLKTDSYVEPNGVLTNFQFDVNDGWVVPSDVNTSGFGNALKFDGTNDWVDIDDLAIPNFYNKTISFYVKTPVAATGTQSWMLFGTSTEWRANIKVRVVSSIGQQVMAQIGYGKGSSTILPDPPGITPDEFGFTTLAANTWYHIALTLERKTAGGTSYYVTGNLYTNGAEGPTVYDTGSSDPVPYHYYDHLTGVCIGALNNGESGWAKVTIDDFRIYDTVLSQSDIDLLADKNNSTNPAATLLIKYDFDECCTTVEARQSGSIHNVYHQVGYTPTDASYVSKGNIYDSEPLGSKRVDWWDLKILTDYWLYQTPNWP